MSTKKKSIWSNTNFVNNANIILLRLDPKSLTISFEQLLSFET